MTPRNADKKTGAMRRAVRQFPVLIGLAAYLIASLGGQGLHMLQHAVVAQGCCAHAPTPADQHAHDHVHQHCHGHAHCHESDDSGSEDRNQHEPQPHDHDNCLICLYQSQAQRVAAPVILPTRTADVALAQLPYVARPSCMPLRAFHSRAPPV